MNRFKKLSALLAGIPVAVLLMAGSAYAESYTVLDGDSLYKIGTLFNTPADTIAGDNKLSGSEIYPGQSLYVRADTYTVKTGDSLYLIAKGHGVALEALRKANNKWDDMIYPGQSLLLPGAAASNSQTASASYTQSELDLLARLITAEAQGEPYQAQVGVGAVVLNRVKDSRFPNTISSVIYEVSGGYHQFTPVKNGWINKPATETSKKAAYDALQGSDPSNGAVYYFDDSATNKWLWSKPIKARIGRMVFVY